MDDAPCCDKRSAQWADPVCGGADPGRAAIAPCSRGRLLVSARDPIASDYFPEADSRRAASPQSHQALILKTALAVSRKN